MGVRLFSDIGHVMTKIDWEVESRLYIIPYFLVLHFGEKYMKIQTK